MTNHISVYFGPPYN